MIGDRKLLRRRVASARSAPLIRRLRAGSEDGAAMLVVMFVLLMATATAVYAVQSTTFEIRAAGYGRRAIQTDALAENGLTAAMAWVDATGPDTMMLSLDRSMNGGSTLDVQPFEIALGAGKRGMRLYGGAGGELNVTAQPRMDEPTATLGERQAMDTFLMVDVYDVHTFTGVLPGFSSSGTARLKFLGATYTARGRARLPGAAAVDASDTRASFHETASDARARGVSGPY